jgi:hypothetical protein
VIDPKPPALCVACGVQRVAWTTPRVDYCYQCLPGGPFVPPPCRGCGTERYFNNGLCVACHPRGPAHIESCVGCLAWGVSRTYRSRCWTCGWWRSHYAEGDCVCCGRHSVVSERRVCRLCWETARTHQQPGRAVDLAFATRFGQQLFFANVQSSRQQPRRRITPADPVAGGKRPLRRITKIGHGHRFEAVAWHQPALFDVPVDPAVVAARVGGADSDLMRHCDQVVRDHAEAHGWSRKQTNDVRRTLRLAEALQYTPNAKINATDVLRLPAQHINVSALSALEVLAAAGVLNDDRVTPTERYFNEHVDGLPDPMTAQLQVWFDVMINGSTTAPRRRPRDPATARLHIHAIAPTARRWAAEGHDSFAEIERHHIVAVLPANAARRHTLEQGLRSLFSVLKSRRLTFINPTRGLPVTDTNSTIPLPMDTGAIRAALNSPDPAAALAVALVAFHAIPSRHLRVIQLTDIVDGRLRVARRDIPLAAPVLPRLAAWLDHRNSTWPNTANPHLFINRRTAPRLIPVSRSFAWDQIGLAAQHLREDRILHEVLATGGDIRLICELFGIGVEAATRYTRVLDDTTATSPRTQGSTPPSTGPPPSGSDLTSLQSH